MRKEFIMHSDSGHAWLEVRRAELKELGIEDKVSGYSYQSVDGGVCYLEEDCDMGIFIMQYKQVYVEIFKVDDWYTEDSFIRKLPHYKI